MTYTTQNKVTHSDTETGRELTVTQEFEDKFPGVAKHWIMGGEVEFTCCGDDGWVSICERYLQDYINSDNPDYNFRIKKRKPQAGEVWINGNAPALITSKGFVWLTNNNHMECDFLTHVPSAEYAAPSVRTYYAREFVKGRGDKNLNIELGEMQEILDDIYNACEYNN